MFSKRLKNVGRKWDTIIGALIAATAILVAHYDGVEALKTSQRAYVSVSPEISSDRLLLHYKVVGQSPALKVGVKVTCEGIDNGRHDMTRIYGSDQDVPLSVMTHGVLFPNSDNSSICGVRRLPSTAPEVFNYKSEFIDVSVRGTVSYSDVFGRQHYTNFCYRIFRFRNTTSTETCPFANDAN